MDFLLLSVDNVNMTEEEFYLELEKYQKAILDSKAPKKLIVAGPGTGKSFFFKKAIGHDGGTKNEYLALTFITNLEKELNRDLGEISHTHTFHGYCHYLLRKYNGFDTGLASGFEYYPPFLELVVSDLKRCNPPINKTTVEITRALQNLSDTSIGKFVLERGNYYNATGYDDSVFRVFTALEGGIIFPIKYRLVIVDEYQDFNLLETSVLSHVIKENRVLVVGDDDQALYCELRNSNPEYIRNLFKEGYETFDLPFCLRCPDSVIRAFESIVNNATARGLLSSRIDKRYDFFPPVKGSDSAKYPKIKLITTTIQKKQPIAANYWGKYIVQEIRKISDEEIKESHEKNFPTVLIIGPHYLLDMIVSALDNLGYSYDYKSDSTAIGLTREKALSLLKEDSSSNLGWRIILETDKPAGYDDILKKAMADEVDLVKLIPTGLFNEVMKEAENYECDEDVPVEIAETEGNNNPSIKLTTYEGAKGLSAGHVFIVGFQNGNLPKDPGRITDIEVCRLLVALTRTRKQCHILTTTSLSGQRTVPSIFAAFLGTNNIDRVNIDKDYWV